MTPADWKPRPLTIGRSVIVTHPPKSDGMKGRIIEVAVDTVGNITVEVSLDDGRQVTVERSCVRIVGESS
jgi:preprotein translocase subunit YajC